MRCQVRGCLITDSILLAMKKVIYTALIMFAGCNFSDSAKDSVNTNDSAAVNDQLPAKINKPEGCYAWQSGKDSAALHLQTSGNNVSGTLSYKLFEKDSNKGSITGNIQDDLIIADYTFQSEGMTSVREVVFKIEGESLIEGYGDIDVDGDTVRFKNKTDLEFNTERPFIKTACK